MHSNLQLHLRTCVCVCAWLYAHAHMHMCTHVCIAHVCSYQYRRNVKDVGSQVWGGIHGGKLAYRATCAADLTLRFNYPLDVAKHPSHCRLGALAAESGGQPFRNLALQSPALDRLDRYKYGPVWDVLRRLAPSLTSLRSTPRRKDGALERGPADFGTMPHFCVRVCLQV